MMNRFSSRSPIDHISCHMALIIPSVATLGILGVPNAKYALSSENFLFCMTCPQIAAWLLLVITHSKVTLSLFLHIVCVRVEWIFFLRIILLIY